MKISYNWLKEYLDLSINPFELADKLSLRGLEVEEVIEQRLDFPNVIVGKVLSVLPHPNAEKLKICQVDVGDEKLPIICGAPNVSAGQTVAVAREGALLPNGLKIRKTKIRGEDSHGMICSQQELAVEEKSEGIWILESHLPIGVALHEALNFETDYIFDIAVTPNRPDCLSHIGIAREVGAIINKKFKITNMGITETVFPAKEEFSITIDCPESCPRYTARLIKNIKVGQSPPWLVRRLEAVGMRSINNVVDVTNYIMLETGQPLHAFDFDLIHQKRIIVRESAEKEKFVTLDDKEHTLRPGTVLICDGDRPVAIGGIMGGLNSEVNQNTNHILLESAYFKPENIQNSSRYLELSTEASQRFERGVDPNGVPFAANRATQLIAELCGGEVYKDLVDAYPSKIENKKIFLDISKINNLLNTNFTSAEMVKMLEYIDLYELDGSIVVPTFRPDLERVADIAEEIARLYGLDNISAKHGLKINYNIKRNELDFFVDELKNILTGLGLQEVMTGSMINSEVWETMTGEKIYPILNPVSNDMSGMRNSLLPSLAQVVQYNTNRKIKNLRLFEINRIYLLKNLISEPADEEIKIGIALSGKREDELWYSSGQDTDFYDIKGLCDSLFSKILLDNWHFISYSHFTIKHDGLEIISGDKHIGFIGELSNKIKSCYEIEEEVFVAEISVTGLFSQRKQEKKYRQIPRYPAVERDLALILDQEIAAGTIEETIRDNGGNLLRNIDLFDVYQGKQIGESKKSLAFRLTFQSQDKTLTEVEVNTHVQKIIDTLSKKHDAKLRE